MKYTLYREGNFYKGTLHAHTNRSDGKLSPADTIARYKKNGFNFLGISDHMVYGYYPEHEEENFLSIPAAELDTFENGVAHHLLAIGDPQETGFAYGPLPRDLKLLDVQALIDLIVKNNNLAIYFHPALVQGGDQKTGRAGKPYRRGNL